MFYYLYYLRKIFINFKRRIIYLTFCCVCCNPFAITIYITDCRIDPKLAKMCQDTLTASDLPIVSVSLKPIDFGKNIVLNMERGYLAMFTQYLRGIEDIDTDIVFLAEHDCLYPAEHFRS